MVALRQMDDFFKDLQKYEKIADEKNVMEILMAGGNALAEDVRKLPKPRRNIVGISHMLDSVRAKEKNKVVQVGWGRYHGVFVERGTSKMRAQPHLKLTWDQNREKYYKIMQEKMFTQGG